MTGNKKVFQILTHIMPWEIDYCLLLFDTLSRAKQLTTQYYKINVVLNVSEYHIDWSKSKLDKEYFIEKINYYSKLLSKFDEVDIKIYDGKSNYGHLDLQKEVMHPDTDYYICISPDQLFDYTILNLFEQSVDLIDEEYYLITAEIPKFWDKSWDVISNNEFSNMPLGSNGYDFLSIDRYEALNINSKKQANLKRIDGIKFAGWLDLYNKNFYEKLVPIPADWNGYGQWDLYSMLIVSNLLNSRYPLSFSQYKLENSVTVSIEYSNWNYGENRSIYKSRLHLNETEDQREYYNTKMQESVSSQINNFVSNINGI